MPSSTSSDGQAGTPVPALARGQQPHHGRELGQPALLAPDAEHLDAVDARGVAAGQQPAPLVRAHAPSPRRPSSRPSHSAIAEPQCSATWSMERLCGALGGRAHAPRSRGAPPRCRRATAAPGRARSSPRRAARRRRARSAMSRASVSSVEHLLGRLRPARPVAGARARWPAPRGRRARRAIAIASVAHGGAARRARRGSASARASPPSTPTRSCESARRRARRPPARAARPRTCVGDHRAPARLLVADRGARQQLGVGVRAAAASRERLERVDRAAGAVAGRPELEQQLGALAGSSTPSSSATPQPLVGLVEGERAAAAARAASTLYSTARSAPASGAAAVKWCARSASRGRAAGALERLAHAQVQLRPPQRR